MKKSLNLGQKVLLENESFPQDSDAEILSELKSFHPYTEEQG